MLKLLVSLKYSFRNLISVIYCKKTFDKLKQNTGPLTIPSYKQ